MQVLVSQSTMFYTRVFRHVRKMRIVAPKHVREAYEGYLEQATDEALRE